MDLTTALTGGLATVLLVATGLTAVISPFLLWLYRRATLQEMEEAVGITKQFVKLNVEKETSSTSHSPLIIQEQQAKTPATTSVVAQSIFHRVSRSGWMAALIYAAGGFAYALVFTAPWIITSGVGFKLNSFLWLFTCYMWPVVLVISLVAVTSRREAFYVAGGYFGIVVVIALYTLAQSSAFRLILWQFVYLWFHINGVGTVLSLAFLRHRIRAVGPLVLVFMVMGTTGALLAFEWATNNEVIASVFLKISALLGFGAEQAAILIYVLGFIVLIILGWWLLGWLGRRYQAKRFSDQSLTIDSLWLLFGIVQSTDFVFEGVGWIFIGLIAFAVYKLVTLVGFALLRRRIDKDADVPTLLLLRVFSLGKRSERFFKRISKRWRRLGPITLIAGPDLVTAEVEPHEFLAFMGGRLSRRFVQGEKDLEERLATLDKQPDPDGYFRVSEFFCHADTWQMTMRRLAEESDSVLMDLRSFSPANQGCLYELGQLLNIVDLRQVVFLVDETTDKPFLEEQLHNFWQSLSCESPNYAAASPIVKLFHVEDQLNRSTKALFLTLFDKSGIT